MPTLLKFIAAWMVLVLGPAFADERPRCVPDRQGKLVCPPPDGRCLADRYGEVVCSTSGGGITPDRYGELVCGPGYCSKNRRGEVFCSKTPRGAAALDRYGEVACTDDCVAATAQACARPKAGS